MSGEFWDSERFDVEAQRLYEAGDYEAAGELLRKALSRYPRSIELRNSLGFVHLASEEYAWARAAFWDVLELWPDNEEALVGAGDALLKLGERSRAFLLFERVVELGFDTDTDLMLAVARALYREDLYGRTIRFYELACEADPRSPEARAELGYALYQVGETEEAKVRIEEALTIRPSLHEARVFYGNLLYDGGDYRGALANFERIPARRMWDPLAVWRTLELMRGFRRLSSDSPSVEPLLEQLERLHREPGPEERLLAELEAAGADDEVDRFPDRNQLDLFALEPAEPEGREPEVHTVRARNGRVYTGDWASIVRAMRDDSSDPSTPLADYMRDAARFVHQLTGLTVPDDDPEAFLRASARAGILRIEK